MERRAEELMELYTPRTKYQQLLLAQHHLSEAPRGERQRTAMREATEHADLTALPVPPGPRRGD